jgi:hypothetical protein
VVVVDEIGHAAKHLGKWRDVVGQRAPPSAMGWSGPDPVIGQPECVQLQEGGLSLEAVGRPGPTVQPMAWVGTRATPKAAGLQRRLWPGRPRMGGLRSATATRTIRDKESLRRHIARRCFTLSGLEGSVAISVTVAPTTMTPSSQCDRHSETVNVSPGIDRHLRWEESLRPGAIQPYPARDAACHARTVTATTGSGSY